MAPSTRVRDLRLLRAAQRGDAAAQAEFFHAHKQRVAAVIHRMTGDASTVDDLVQETFVSAFLALDRFRADASIDTWLHRIAVNKVRNHWDSQRRRRARELASQDRPRAEPSTPEENIVLAQHRARLRAALEELPEELRLAFVLRAVEGLSLKEASAVLDVPISTLSYRTRRAEDLLCEMLDLPGRKK